MTMRSSLRLLTLAGIVLGAGTACAAEAVAVRLGELAEQNGRLQDQVQAQQRMIDALAVQLKELQEAGARQARPVAERREEAAEAVAGPDAFRRERAVRVAGEAGFAYFKTGSAGAFPKGEFRVDDPVISFEAPVRKGVYFFTELKLLPRETNVDSFQLGEMYVDFEDVSAAWGQPGALGVRAGRINIPFGEEYQVRGPVANPLISHSLADVWGTDEGVEIYGQVGPLSYAVAVQNGGASRLRDFNADKAVVARIGGDPTRWLHLSASAMRTGELAAVADNLSEVWFANGYFRALGPAKTTGTFWASLFEVDATARWRSGHLGAALGQVRFGDSDTTADNSRRLRYGHVEAVQVLAGSLYGAVRYSEVRAPRGYPLAGWGAAGTFFYRPSFAEQLRRLSLGLGYRFGEAVVLKAEYARESGRMTNGAARNDEDFLGGELAVKF